MKTVTAPKTAAAATLLRLRSDIVAGTLAPASRLKVTDLSLTYGIGATPIREALLQLAATGFVEAEGQKGFRVPETTLEELTDIVRTRRVLEAEALRLAIRHGGPAWEAGITSAFAAFRARLEACQSADDAKMACYERLHHAFHRAVLAGCPYETLLTLCDSLYLRTSRYRLLLTRIGYPFSPQGEIAAHAALMNLALARSSAEAVSLLVAAIDATAEAVAAMLASGAAGQPHGPGQAPA